MKQLPRLVELDADDNRISNVQALSSAAELVYLKMSDNAIEDIAPFGNLKKLTYLDISNNKIKDFSPLRLLSKSLTYLEIDGNQITERYGLQLNDNYLDLSQGTQTYKIFNKLNTDPYGIRSQSKAQRLMIGNKTAYLGDSIYKITAAPFIQTGRTYVPIRFISRGTLHYLKPQYFPIL